MRFHEVLAEIGLDGTREIAITYCQNNNLDLPVPLNVILEIVANDLSLAPRNIGSIHDDEAGAIGKWVTKYITGYQNRPSNRLSSVPGTVPDPIIDTIISERLPNLSAPDIENIKYAHRLSMSAENILGLFLEEYLANELAEFGWHCAWGDIVRSVDFVHNNGSLLQIKNRSNSENSSSSRVREGTNIIKWYRVQHNNGAFKWQELNELFQTDKFSEEHFNEFVISTVQNNQNCLAIENGNTWVNIN